MHVSVCKLCELKSTTGWNDRRTSLNSLLLKLQLQQGAFECLLLPSSMECKNNVLYSHEEIHETPHDSSQRVLLPYLRGMDCAT